MIRLLGKFASFAVGATFAGVLLLALFVGLYEHFTTPEEKSAAHEFHREPKALALASDGPVGHFDQAQLQRGFQVYKEVCSGCHSLNQVAFRDLQDIGYSEAQVKAIAAGWAIQVPSVNPDTGETEGRAALPSDKFPSPYANDIAAAAANNNALPPDLSLMTKAREGGAAYVYSLLTGYQRQPAKLLKEFPDAKTPGGLHYNPYFANLNLAMPQPITTDGQVTYGEGSPKPTVDQMSKDVAAFLVWTAEPNLEKRHATGITVLIFLAIATLLGFNAYKYTWRDAKRKVAPKGVLDPENQARVKRAEAKAGVEG